MRREPARRAAPAPPELGGWLPPVDGAALPEDLAVLGARLEAAAGRTVARRRALRRVLFNGACAVFVGVPLALAGAASDLAPASHPVAKVARANPSVAPPSRLEYVIQHAPDVPLAAATGPVCLKDPDCRAPESPSLVPVEIGTIY